MGKLTFYYGAMNSGKTIDLIRTAYNYNENGFDVLIIKPSIDTKADDNIETRVGLRRRVDYKIGPNDSFFDILKGKLDGIKCILIDEAQFLTQKQVVELKMISTFIDELDIICYGLKLDFRNQGFEGSIELLKDADHLEKLKTICGCGQMARCNARCVNGEFLRDGEQVVIDGASSNVEYVPLCPRCYEEKVNGISEESVKKLLKIKR